MKLGVQERLLVNVWGPGLFVSMSACWLSCAKTETCMLRRKLDTQSSHMRPST